MPVKLKIFLTLIGLSAIALPIFLIVIDFSPVGYFYPPSDLTKNNAKTSTPTENIPSTTPSSLALLSVSEFQTLENDTSFLVINLDSALKKTSPRYLDMTVGELKTLLQEETDIPSLLRTTKVILVSSDVVSSEEVAKKLMEKGLKVSIYLYHD